MNDQEPENDQLTPDWLVLPDQRTLEIRMVEYRGEDLAESTGFSQVLERTKLMPHFSAVRSGWENACANLQHTQIAINRFFSSELRRRLAKNDDKAVVPLLDALNPPSRGRPKADPDADFDLLSAWLHCGIWMLSHDDQAFLMQLLFRGKTPIRTDALRKRYKRRGLLGWHDFPQTYQQAPLACSEREGKVALIIAPCWEPFFT